MWFKFRVRNFRPNRKTIKYPLPGGQFQGTLFQSTMMNQSGTNGSYEAIHNKFVRDFRSVSQSHPAEDVPIVWMDSQINLEYDTTISETVQFFRRKNILLTGATGFLGKLFIEKILRSCEDIGTIYVLIRAKKGVPMPERIDKMVQSEVFNKLHGIKPHFRQKLFGLCGDIGEEGLALSPEDRNIITKNVHLIIHGAATVNFNQKLHIAANMNIRGTHEMLKLAKECKFLKGLVYISTAFSNCVKKEIDELIYHPPMTSNKLFQILKEKSEEEVEDQLESILQGFPNTYTFTKCLAEYDVAAEAKEIPLMIFRPSIIMPTYREPIKSWTDNIYGPIGFSMVLGLGALHSNLCDVTKISDIVPADYVMNAMIVATAKTFRNEKPRKVEIFNYISSEENPITYQRHIDLIAPTLAYTPPATKAVWHCSFYTTSSPLLHKILILFLQYIPALLVDGVLKITRKELRVYPLVQKVCLLVEKLSFFSLQQWKFHNTNTQKLWKETSKVDQTIFPFSMKILNWNVYYACIGLGIREFICKDDRATIPASRKNYLKRKYLHYAVKYGFLVLTWYFVFYVFQFFKNIWYG